MGDGYDDDDFEDYDEDFEDDDEAEPEPAKAASPKVPAPKQSAAPAIPQNVKAPPQKGASVRQSKSIDPKVLEMQRAMAKENEAAAAVAGGGSVAGRAANRHAPVRQSMAPIRQSQATVPGSTAGKSPKDGKARSSREGKERDAPAPAARKNFEVSLGTGSPKQGGKSKVNKADSMALAKHNRQRYADLITSGKVALARSSTFMLFDMHPLTPFELYARGFSRADKESTGRQCPDDEPLGLSDEAWSSAKAGWKAKAKVELPERSAACMPKRQMTTQTDDVTRANAAVQCPEDLAARSKHEKEKQRERAKLIVHTGEAVNLIGQDTSRLEAFLKEVEPVVSALMVENSKAAERRNTNFGLAQWAAKTGGETAFSRSSTAVDSAVCREMLRKRPIRQVCFGGLADQFLGVVYDCVQETDKDGAIREPASGFPSMGVICVWKVPDQEDAAEPKYRMAAHISGNALVPSATFVTGDGLTLVSCSNCQSGIHQRRGGARCRHVSQKVEALTQILFF